MKLKEIAENHGLTPEGVDYALTQYQIVISEITHGMMSKLSYDAKDIIRMAQERWCDTRDLKEPEAMKPIYNEQKYGSHLPHCGNCEKVLPNNVVYGKVNFCHYCGKAVKWYADD